MNKVIQAKDIIKSYGVGDEKRNVLDGVSLSVNQGDFVSVMGPSGSGKSTLIYTLSGMDTLDGGTVKVNDTDLSSLKERELADLLRKEIGVVFQQPTLLKNLNILDNIVLPAMRDNRKKLPSIRKKAEGLMDQVRIGQLGGRMVTQVSGGQLQRAGICRALINDPKIVFGDEPTGALNSHSAAEIMKIFSDINAAGTTVMIVTHDAKVAAQTERVLFMLDGKIVSDMNLGKFEEEKIKQRIASVTERMRDHGI